MFDKVNIIILHVSDIDVSEKFYRDVLKLQVLEDKPRWKSFQLGDIVLALRPWVPETEDERPVKWGIALGFDVDDVDKRIEELEKHGAHILIEPRDESFGRYAEIVDPDGYILMLISEDKK